MGDEWYALGLRIFYKIPYLEKDPPDGMYIIQGTDDVNLLPTLIKETYYDILKLRLKNIKL